MEIKGTKTQSSKVFFLPDDASFTNLKRRKAMKLITRREDHLSCVSSGRLRAII
jgi:hypothetical protein